MSNTISAAATGLPGLSRRGFARSAVATLAVTAVPPLPTVAAPAGGAMVALYAAYVAAVDVVNALPDDTPQAEVDRLWQVGADLADAALVATIETVADGAAGIRLFVEMTEGSEPMERDTSLLLRIASRLAEIGQAGGIA